MFKKFQTVLVQRRLRRFAGPTLLDRHIVRNAARHHEPKGVGGGQPSHFSAHSRNAADGTVVLRDEDQS